MRISFGPFAFDRQSRLLWREGTEIALPPRVLGVLELLIDRAGQVVARQDLLDGVWKDAFVTDTSLAEAVSYLRQALGDDPQSPRYIQTVHRRGYRFLAPIAQDAVPSAVLTLPLPDTPDRMAAGNGIGSASLYWQLLPLWAALLSGAMLSIAIWRTGPQTAATAPAIVRFEISPGAGTIFDRHPAAIAVAENGRTIAWAGCRPSGDGCALYTRTLDRLESAKVPGTDGASHPFFSPDGRWIGFFADGKLKKIAAAGGSPSILADAPSPGGGAWNANGQIAFAATAAGGLSLVSADGGEVKTLTSPHIERGEVRHALPAWLPSGALIFIIQSTTLPDAPGELAVMRRDGREWTTLRGGVSRALLAGPAYLLLSNGTDLQAATFDERSLTLTGGSDSVAASSGGTDGVAQFGTGGGALVVAPLQRRRVAWDDGQEADAIARWSSVTASPDGRRVAGVAGDGIGSDVWVADLSSGATTRITYGGSNVSPVWSPDGSRVFFATRSSGAFSIASRKLDDQTITAVPVSAPSHVFPTSVASDGRIAVIVTTRSGHVSVGIVPASGGTVQMQPSGPFDESDAVFSPDGRWLALQSSASGRAEIVGRSLRDGRQIQLTNDGGIRPRWSADGRSIYYHSDGRLMRVPFDEQGVRRTPELAGSAQAGSVVAATPTGRLLIETLQPSDRAVVILQWLQELRQRLPLPVRAPR